MTETPFKVGIIGAGNISDAYLRISKRFEVYRVTSIADLELSRAQAKAEAFGVRASSVADLLRDDSLDIVVNLTVPAVHAEVSRAVLESGKHVYSEKPLATLREDGKALLELAAETNLRVGCAPDTFLGAGLQTCRALLDEGVIGQPIAATAFMMSNAGTPTRPFSTRRAPGRSSTWGLTTSPPWSTSSDPSKTSPVPPSSGARRGLS
jgi:predicted dehydrogenase